MRLNKDYWLFATPIAHRGLWDENFIENSLPAYKRAADNGYPIEIDLYSSTDGVIYCFHDKTLARMTGANGFIFEKSSAELDELRLLNSDLKIPKFAEILELAKGKVPLLIELKDQPLENFVEKVVDILKDYGGEFAVQSFNPFYIKKIKKLAPNFIRGILGTEDAKDEKPLTQYVIKNMPFNFTIKPDFISYHFTALPLKKRKTKKTPVICWTVTSENDYQKIKPYAKNIIFENFIPKK